MILRPFRPKFTTNQPNKHRIEFFPRSKAAKHRGHTPQEHFRAQGVATGHNQRRTQTQSATTTYSQPNFKILIRNFGAKRRTVVAEGSCSTPG